MISKISPRTYSFFASCISRGFCAAVQLAAIATSFELLLRLLWNNPYAGVWQNYKDYVKLARPWERAVYDISELYAGAGRSIYRTGRYGEVLPRQRPVRGLKAAYVFGGSTTECRYVTEGARWPELIESAHAINFGYSGNGLGDTYFNLKFLLKKTPRPVSKIFIMHGINDFSLREAFISGVTGTSMDGWKGIRANHASNLPRARRYFYGRDFWVYVRDRLGKKHKNKDRRVVSEYVASTKRNDLGSRKVSAQEFNSFLNGEMRRLLGKREQAMEHLLLLVKPRGIKVTLITYPHAYRKDFRPYRGLDLREYPVLGDKNMTLPQAALVMKMLNDQIRSLARKYDMALVDMARRFEELDPSEFFYDSIHLTEKGSRTFAQIFNHELENQALNRL